jgi:hypothetical protein
MCPSDTLEIFWGCFTPQLSPTHIPTHQQSPVFLALAEMGYCPVKTYFDTWNAFFTSDQQIFYTWNAFFV